MDRYLNIFKNKREDRRDRYVYYWLFGIIVISILVMIIQLIYNYDAKGGRCKTFKDATDYKFFNSIIDLPPNFPKPFINLA